jgi:chromate transporter
VVELSGFGMTADAPVLATVDWAALALTVAAVLAIFWLRIGMVRTLAGCALSGLLLHLAGVVQY